jgi:hypothetical protein
MTGQYTTGQHGARVHGCPGHAGEPVWLLTTSAGEWVAECGHPGCGWTVADLVADLVDDLAACHALTHRPLAPGAVGESSVRQPATGGAA